MEGHHQQRQHARSSVSAVAANAANANAAAAASRDGRGGGGKTGGGKPKKMFDEEVDRYETYEDYLDSLVSEEDHLYLEDEEMARIIAELGYRENFYKMKTRLEEKRLITRKSSKDNNTNGASALGGGSYTTRARMLSSVGTDVAGAAAGAAGGPTASTSSADEHRDPFVREIRARAKDLSSGDLHTVVFMRTMLYRKARDGTTGSGVEVSGHMDLGQRLANDNFVSYVTGTKRIVPRSGDLTYYNWNRGQADFRSTPNFEVVVQMPKLLLRHRPSGSVVDISAPELRIDHDDEFKLIQDSEDSWRWSYRGWLKVPCRPASAAHAVAEAAEDDEDQNYAYLYDFRRVRLSEAATRDDDSAASAKS